MELQFHDLKKNYGKKQALKGINLTLKPGIYGLLGPNGAGKSTLMNILTGNLKPTAGYITLDGQDIHTLGEAFRSRLGYCPQQQTLYPSFTGEQFLYYMASLQGMKKSEAAKRIDWVLGEVSLLDVRHKPIRSYSGGMKQRLLIAQSILHDPDILILDEPTAGLDPHRSGMADIIKTHKPAVVPLVCVFLCVSQGARGAAEEITAGIRPAWF
jgi:ABC-type multidrug transport system ATPase subunit